MVEDGLGDDDSPILFHANVMDEADDGEAGVAGESNIEGDRGLFFQRMPPLHLYWGRGRARFSPAAYLRRTSKTWTGSLRFDGIVSANSVRVFPSSAVYMS